MQDGRRGAPRPRPRTTLESRVLRKAHARFGEGRMEKCWHRQLASRLLHTIVGFQHEGDARRFLDAVRARFEAFALSLHPDKTRLIEFGRLAAAGRARRGLGKPETFDFLGFTFVCSVSRRGTLLLKRKTRRDRLRAKPGEIKE